MPDESYESCRLGAGRAVERGWKVLASGGSALDACEQAIIELEEDPVFDAGIGSHLNRDGVAQLDAILMDGVSLKSGAVACVEHIRNPIQLARLVLERSEHMLLTGYGAEQFAREHGFPVCDPAIFRIATESIAGRKDPLALCVWEPSALSPLIYAETWPQVRRPEAPSLNIQGVLATRRWLDAAATPTTSAQPFHRPVTVSPS